MAEEVERVYPELLTYGPDGKVQSVRYLELTAMLLNELQKQAARLRSKDAELAAHRRRFDALEQQQVRLNSLGEQVAALERPTPAVTERPGSVGSLAQR
jgi:small-conductance mechanosensitive channel